MEISSGEDWLARSNEEGPIRLERTAVISEVGYFFLRLGVLRCFLYTMQNFVPCGWYVGFLGEFYYGACI